MVNDISFWDPLGKKNWGPGPWQREPDRVEFEAHGFPCLMVRGVVTGAWCGYVGVPEGHWAYGKPYGSVEVEGIHSELNYAAKCSGRICHVPKPGKPDHVWWLGFDCAHFNDIAPALEARLRDVMGVNRLFGDSWRSYKTVAWVKNEVKRLARRLEAMGGSPLQIPLQKREKMGLNRDE